MGSSTIAAPQIDSGMAEVELSFPSNFAFQR
jgi:hypothetical protein